MIFENEEELYGIAAEFQKIVSKSIRSHPVFGLHKRVRARDRLITDKRQQDNGQRLYLLGEARSLSGKPMDYVHRELAHRIERHPQDWLILRERADDTIEGPCDSPVDFYFQELSGMLGIPYEDPLERLWSYETRNYIEAITGLAEGSVDRLILFYYLQSESSNNIVDIPGFISKMSAILEKPTQYMFDIFLMGPPNLDFEETVGKAWNEYSSLSFPKLCEKYSDKKDILISVNDRRLPVFG